MSTAIEKSIDHVRRITDQLTQSQKRAYLMNLTEDEFRDKVVRPLFRRLKYDEGRDTHGPEEHGKDCYFFQNNELTGVEVTVVQTKAGNITKGSAKPSHNIDVIVSQLRTALETPVVLVNPKNKKLPIRAFLVASGEIRPAAIAHIVAEIGSPHLQFLDYEKLIPLIREHMPELWLNIHSDLLPYFRAVVKAIDDGYDFAAGGVSLLPQSKYNPTADDTFADLNVIRADKPRIPTARQPKKTEPIKIDQSPLTHISDRPERRVLLVGEGGSGKTTGMKRIMYQLSLRPVDNPNKVVIPVFIRAKDMLDGGSLLDHALSAVQRLGADLKTPFSNDDLTSGKVLIMVDGLDEVTDEGATKLILDTVNRHAEDYPAGQIIIASRNTELVRNDAALKKFATFRLTDLNFNQILRLVDNYIKRNPSAPYSAADALKALQDIHGVDFSPLIVTIFIATADASRADAPANITELFNKYMELMLGRWDEGKGLHQQIHAPVKEFIVSRIAFRMHQREEMGMPLSEFKREVLDELAIRGLQDQGETIYEEMVFRSNIFRVDANDRIEFRHLVFQEYFAGRAIPNEAFIVGVLGKYWWRNAIVFYFGSHPGDVAALSCAAEALPELTKEDSLVAGSAVGLGLQACYLSELEDKFEIYKRVIETFAALKVGAESDNRAAVYPIVFTLGHLFGLKDSVALNASKYFVERLYAAFETQFAPGSIELEEAVFWLIVGLVEAGHLDIANVYLERFKPTRAYLLFGLFLDLVVTRQTRIVDHEAQKVMDKRIKQLAERLNPVIASIRRDMDSEQRMLSGGPQVALSSGKDKGHELGSTENDIQLEIDNGGDDEDERVED